MGITTERKLENDWYDGVVPENAIIDPLAFLETTYSFSMFRSLERTAFQIGEGSSAYTGTMFDVGPRGRIRIGRYSMVNVSWLICDRSIEIGNHVLISWNAVLMDNYRQSTDPILRRGQLERYWRERCEPDEVIEPQPVCIEDSAWIGFDSVILPGVTIGRGAIVGCRSVVSEDVPPNSIAVGNPARVVRQLDAREVRHAGP